MSNSLAIAAVTATLRDVLKLARQALPGDPDPLADLEVVCKPPDKARPNNDGVNTLNLFLYETVPDGALRNMEIPPLRAGETGSPPLPLRLHYLLTAFGRNNDELLAHRMLGRAMSLLHDRAVLMPADIQAALPGADLHRQIERVRVTAQPLSIEEMSKLWTTFQVNYRLSAGYEASVVLIDSARTSRTPLPVLWRGPLDRGLDVYPDPTPPYPALFDLLLPANQPAARLGTAAMPGDVVTLLGTHLDGDAVALVRFPGAGPHPRVGARAHDLGGRPTLTRPGWPT